MKTIVVVILSLMMLGTSAYASPISQQWIKTYGNPSDGINCIQQTIDGGYIAAGHTRTFAPDSAIYMLVLKIDSNGDVSWQKSYHYGTWINDAYSIQQTTDGGYIVAGFTSFLGYGKGWILKLDSSGDIVWQKTYEPIAQFTSIQQTGDGGYITVAESSLKIIVLKLDSVGDITWQKSYDLLTHDNPTTIQQTMDGGYVVTGHIYVSDYDIFVLKINSNGDVSWAKIYSEDGKNTHPNIQETLDGGFAVICQVDAGSTSEDLWVVKLGSSGDIEWQKAYGGSMDDEGFAIQKTLDGGLVAIGYTSSFGYGGADAWLMKLNNSGDIEWEKVYGGSMDDGGLHFGNTQDGGYVLAGYSRSFEPGGLMILKLDSNGEIPDCDIKDVSNATVSDTTVIGQDVSVTVELPSIIVTATNSNPQNISVETSVVCYYENPTDIDGDGIENDSGEATANSIQIGAFLAEVDNCSVTPNGPFLGTCAKGYIGSTCITDQACGIDGMCSMNQEDFYPPQGNGIGDACDCEGNFDCDADCDGTDAATFKTDFGRSTFGNPCISGNPCNGDFDCDQDCDGTDAANFKEDFGRSGFLNPCPICTQGDWCVYP